MSSLRLVALSSGFVFAISMDAGPAGAATPNQAELCQQVDDLFADFDKPATPGGAVGIVRNGDLIYSKGFGNAHIGYGAPNTPQTVFDIASASKSFTSACIALLMDQGKLNPDDDVRKLVPEMKNLPEAVHVRHMLRCESGIWAQFHIMPLAGWDNVPTHHPFNQADLLTVLSGQRRLPFKPGTDFQYGSSDFFLLGVIVERLSGKSLAEFAQENLFEPCGMTRTFYEEDPGLVVKNRAIGHWHDSGWSRYESKSNQIQPWRTWRSQAQMAGGSGVHTCVDDLFRWDQALRNGNLPQGKYMTEFVERGSVLGNRFTLDVDAYRKHVKKNAANPPAGQYRGTKRIQFTGGFWGLNACLARFPDHDFTVICLSNNDNLSGVSKVREIADLFLPDVLEPLPEPNEQAAIQFIDLPDQDLVRCTGAFRRPGNHPVWQTVMRDGQLHLDDHLDNSYVLQPISKTRFKAVEDSPFYPSARFDFHLDEHSDAKGMTLWSHENGFKEVLNFERIELVQPSVADLKVYAGTYFSDELSATYQFKVDDGALWLRVGSRRWERLKPLNRDQFGMAALDGHDQRFFRFQRNEERRVNGLSVGFWRIRDLRFVKTQ